MPRPIYVACLGIAVASLWGGYLIPGVMLVGMAACMRTDDERTDDIRTER